MVQSVPRQRLGRVRPAIPSAIPSSGSVKSPATKLRRQRQHASQYYNPADDAHMLEKQHLLDEATATSQTHSGRWAGAKANVSIGALKGMLLLNLASFLFGSNSVIIKHTEDFLDPATLDALRFSIAALCFAPWMPAAVRDRRIFLPSLELGLWLAVGFTAQAYGLMMTSASNGAFTGTFTVLSVPFLVGLSGRRIQNRTWIAALAALAGVGLLTTSHGEPNWGDFWCVISAVVFGVHTWRSEAVTADLPAQTLEVVAAQLLVVAIATALLATPDLVQLYARDGWTGLADHTATVPWGEVCFMGLATTAFTLWLELEGLKNVSAPLAAVIYTMEPLWGASFAWLLLGERWGSQGWLGAAMVLAAAIFTQLYGDPAERVTTGELAE